MNIRIALALLLSACQPTKSDVEDVWQDDGNTGQLGDAVTPEDTAVEQVGTDDSGEADTADDIDEVGGADHPVFSSTTIHEIALTIAREGLGSLHATPFEYTSIDVTIDGLTLTQVGVRIKGKYGSFDEITGKPSLKLDFNHYVEGQEYEGLEKLNLNNAIVDCGYNRDRVSYELWRQLDLPSLRTGYAHVTLNGEDYGLYVLVEAPDDEWLNRTFKDDSGNFYDGKYYMTDDWSYYSFVDFQTGLDDYFRLDEGTDVALADVKAITAVREDYARSDEYYAALDPLINWEKILRHLAAEQWIGQNDGYALNRNNYFVYFDPDDDGRALMTPFDLDYAFLRAEDWGFSWRSPSGALLSNCLKDDTCEAAWFDAIRYVAEHVDEEALIAYADASVALIAEAADADPKRSCGSASVTSYQRAVTTWIDGRNSELLDYWDL